MAPGTVAHQAPLSMGFVRQEYWSGLPYPPPGDHLPYPGIELFSPALTGRFFTTAPPEQPLCNEQILFNDHRYYLASQMALAVKNLAAFAEDLRDAGSPIQFLINLVTPQKNLCLDSLEHLLPLTVGRL